MDVDIVQILHPGDATLDRSPGILVAYHKEYSDYIESDASVFYTQGGGFIQISPTSEYNPYDKGIHVFKRVLYPHNAIVSFRIPSIPKKIYTMRLKLYKQQDGHIVPTFRVDELNAVPGEEFFLSEREAFQTLLKDINPKSSVFLHPYVKEALKYYFVEVYSEKPYVLEEKNTDGVQPVPVRLGGIDPTGVTCDYFTSHKVIIHESQTGVLLYPMVTLTVNETFNLFAIQKKIRDEQHGLGIKTIRRLPRRVPTPKDWKPNLEYEELNEIDPFLAREALYWVKWTNNETIPVDDELVKEIKTSLNEISDVLGGNTKKDIGSPVRNKRPFQGREEVREVRRVVDIPTS